MVGYGLDQNTYESNEAAEGLFGIMAGKELSSDNTIPYLMAYRMIIRSFKSIIRR
ncbi:MAG: hypothetical protein NC485_12955 [Ruminococcus flavefaciens]|nr:hypothetical protein [Ruminococcus flavefaciens]MCM1061707.1 hypothetical protein [Eubacterium sp.]